MFNSSSLLLLIILILSITCTADVSIHYDYLGSQPDGSWQSNNPAPFDGFCFDYVDRTTQVYSSSTSTLVDFNNNNTLNAYRVISSYSDFFYSQTITLAVINPYGFTTIMNWIMKIVIQEVLGYAVAIDDNPMYGFLGGSFNLAFTRNGATADIIATSGLATLDQEFQTLSNQLISSQGAESAGMHEAADRTGIYVSTRAIYMHPEFALETWQTWSFGVNGAYVQTPGNPNIQQLVDLFKNDSWSILTPSPGVNYLWNNATDPGSGYNCPPDYIFDSATGNLGYKTGCNDPNWPGLYVPPQCYPNPREQCVVVVQPTPFETNGYTSNQVRNLNLAMVVAFSSVILNNAALMQAATKNVLIAGGSTQTMLLTPKCGSMYCTKRIQLPPYDTSCDTLSPYNSDLGNFYCDYKPNWAYKFYRYNLNKIAPRVVYALQQFNMNGADLSELLILQFASNSTDYKRAACDWLTNPVNIPQWQTWITPPAQCTQSDYFFTLGTCDETTGQYVVKYFWLSPQSCLGGVDLPMNQYVSCGYFTSSTTQASNLLGFSAVTMLLTLFSLILIIFSNISPFGSSISNVPDSALKALLKADNKNQYMNNNNNNKSTSQTTITGRQRGKYSKYFLLLPVVQLMGHFLYPFHVGCILLIVKNFVHVLSGDLSNSLCWTYYSLNVIGLSCIGLSLACAVLKFQQQLSKLLQVLIEFKLNLLTVSILIVEIVLLVIGASSDSLLFIEVSIIEGGAQVPNAFCSPGPAWLQYTLIIINSTYVIFALLLTLKLFIQLSLNIGSGSNSSLANAPAITKTRSRYKSTTKVQMIKIRTLTLTLVIYFVLAVILISLNQVPVYYQNNFQLIIQELYTVCSLLIAMFIILYALSFLHVYRFSMKLVKPKAPPGLTVKSHASNTVVPWTDKNSTSVVKSSAVDYFNSNANDTKSISINSNSSNSDPESELDSLRSILQDPIAALMLEQYAEHSFDAENIHFLLACKQYFTQLKSVSLMCSQLLSGADDVYKEFIIEGAPQQINVSSNQRLFVETELNQLLAKVKTVNHSNKSLTSWVAPGELRALARIVFSNVIPEIFNLLSVNTYPRFLQSSFATRANALILWSDNFVEMNSREQNAMMQRLKIQNQIQRQVAEDTMNNNNNNNHSVHSRGNQNNYSRERKENAILIRKKPSNDVNQEYSNKQNTSISFNPTLDKEDVKDMPTIPNNSVQVLECKIETEPVSQPVS